LKSLAAQGRTVLVSSHSPQSGTLARLLEARGATVVRPADDTLRLTGATAEAVGELARANRLTLRELSWQQA
jgi:hypothetical protein